ncbi:MAG: pyridoxal phosphate-dependent aminotransferase [Gammaproteobacteria bacterium]|nr:pyridoxal phosphate-dependent aminotransferase [Gammaproteobacteria bacterium]
MGSSLNSRVNLAASLRLQAVQTPIVPTVAELIRANPGTISLGQGVVHYGPPSEAIASVQRFLADAGNHKYGLVHGISELRDAIAQKLHSYNYIEVHDRYDIVVTAGSNMGFVNALLAISEPGDEVIISYPYYFNHEMAITMLGCRPVLVTTDQYYQPRIDDIRNAVTERTRAVVTISPNNPTGAVYSEDLLRAVNALCRDRGIYQISDEAYEDFVYDGRQHFAPAAIEDANHHTISLYSLSKAYGFASWRIGYMVIPLHLLESIKKIQDTVLICPPVVSQYAAVGAVNADRSYVREKIRGIAEVRTMVLQRLVELDELIAPPRSDGAFYILLKVNTTQTSMVLVERLIKDHGVAAIPGSAFGITDGCYLRIAYGALEKATAEQGIERLITGLRSLLRE